MPQAAPLEFGTVRSLATSAKLLAKTAARTLYGQRVGGGGIARNNTTDYVHQTE